MDPALRDAPITFAEFASVAHLRRHLHRLIFALEFCSGLGRPLNRSDFAGLVNRLLGVKLTPRVVDVVFALCGDAEGKLDGVDLVHLLRHREALGRKVCRGGPGRGGAGAAQTAAAAAQAAPARQQARQQLHPPPHAPPACRPACFTPPPSAPVHELPLCVAGPRRGRPPRFLPLRQGLHRGPRRHGGRPRRGVVSRGASAPRGSPAASRGGGEPRVRRGRPRRVERAVRASAGRLDSAR
jgi:hypothetical protein